MRVMSVIICFYLQDNELAVHNPECTEAQADSEEMNNLKNSSSDVSMPPPCESSEDSTVELTVSGSITSRVDDREPAPTCAAADSGPSSAAHSEAIANKGGLDGSVVEHNRKDSVEFDNNSDLLPMEQATVEDRSGREEDAEFDDMPELVPMETTTAEDGSPPVVLSDVEDVQFDLPSSLKGILPITLSPANVLHCPLPCPLWWTGYAYNNFHVLQRFVSSPF